MAKFGTYLVNGEAGNVGMAGAPILNYSLLVVSATGKVSGHAVISQALGSNSEKHISDITGEIHGAGLGPVTKLVALRGTYYEPLTPPAIGTIEVPFLATLAVDDAWNGKGGFSCGSVKVENVPVQKVAL
jgi:hypothetical protein